MLAAAESMFRAASPSRDRSGTFAHLFMDLIIFFHFILFISSSHCYLFFPATAVMGAQRYSPARPRPAAISSPPPLSLPLADLAASSQPPPSSLASPPVTVTIASLVTSNPLSGSMILPTPASPRTNYSLMPDLTRTIAPSPIPSSPRQAAVCFNLVFFSLYLEMDILL